MRKMGIVAVVAGAVSFGCGGASTGAASPTSYSQPVGPLCDVLRGFVDSGKEAPPFASTHADPIADYLWHTKQRPEGAMACTVSRPSAEAGDATILCEYDGGSDPHDVQAGLATKVKACLQGGDWQASADDSTEASAWFSNEKQVKVSVYVLPAQGGKLDVMLDLDPLPASAAAPSASP